jgi:AcrR family transcriptional regulator
MSESLAHGSSPAPLPCGDRERILDAAAQAFQAHGYEAVSFAELGFDLPSGEDGLRAQFASKRAVAMALLAERVVRQAKAEWLDPVRQAPDLAGALVAVFRDTAAELDACSRRNGAPIRHLALDLAMSDPDFRILVDALFEAWRKTIAERLTAQGHPDPETLATFAVSAFSGVMALAKTNQSTGVILAAADQVAAVFAQKKRPDEAGR